MTKVMMTCTRNGSPIYVGLDLSSDTNLNSYAGKAITCPACGHNHALKKLYFEGNGPTEKHRYNVALESAPMFSADIGVYISCFALIEGYMPKLLSRLLNIDEQDAHTIIGRFQMGERTNLLEALSNLRDSTNLESVAIKAFIPRLIKATAMRNKYAHSQYSITFDDAIVVTSWLYDSKRNKQETTETLATIANEVEKIQSLICDLHGYIYRNEMPPSPKGSE